MTALFHIERDLPGTTLQQQIREKLISAIVGGYIPPDEPLPSSRRLAKNLQVARNTIVLVYEELAADGYLIARERSGYYIDPELNLRLSARPHSDTSTPQEQLDWSQKLKCQPALLSPPQSHNWQSYRYPFVYGQLGADLFPLEHWRKCWRDAASVQAIRDWSSDQFDSDDPLLVEQIQQHLLPTRGIQAQPDEILVTLGSQQAIYLLAQLLMDNSSRFAIEDPGYLSAAHIAQVHGAEVCGIDVDNEGLIVDQRLDDCDLVYVTPSYQCPTTVTMSLARRQALLEKAQQQDLLILEDDYEMEMDYDTQPTPALKSLDRHGRVLYLGSLSKTLAPGLRMGFLVAPAPVIAAARRLRQLMLRHPPLNNQRAVALFLAQGYHDALLRKLSRAFKKRREAMDKALQNTFANSYTPPTGGSSFWCQLPESISDKQLVAKAASQGVLVLAGSYYQLQPQNSGQFVKLGFSAIGEQDIAPGIELLGKLLKAN